MSTLEGDLFEVNAKDFEDQSERNTKDQNFVT